MDFDWLTSELSYSKQFSTFSDFRKLTLIYMRFKLIWRVSLNIDTIESENFLIVLQTKGKSFKKKNIFMKILCIEFERVSEGRNYK